MDALSDAILALHQRGETALILAHPCGATRFAVNHMRAQLGYPIGEPGGQDVIRHEAAPGKDEGSLTACVVCVSFHFWSGDATYDDWADNIWHLVREPKAHAYSASFKFNVNSLWTSLKLPEKGKHHRAPVLAEALRAGVDQAQERLRNTMISVTEFNEQAEQIASRRFRAEDIPGWSDGPPEGHSHIRGPRCTPTWTDLGKLDIEYALKMKVQSDRYGYPDSDPSR